MTKKPDNFKQKWNKGDIIFKGKYSSGVTPKYIRPALNLKTRGNKRKRTDLDEMDQELSSVEKDTNHFLSITPQMKRKVRKWSFQADNEKEQLECLSPPRDKKVICETPTPAKSLWRYPKIMDDATPMKAYEEMLAFEKRSSDRGERFLNDFEEISIIGKGHFGSVVRFVL